MRYPQIKALLLYSPPVRSGDPRRFLAPLLIRFTQSLPKPASDFFDPIAAERLWSYDRYPVATSARVLDLISRTRRQLHQVQQPRPNRRFGIINLVLIGFGVLLLLSSFIPNQGMQQVPRVPYSLFIDQVNDGAVKRAFITQDQIRYELSEVEEGAPSVLATGSVAGFYVHAASMPALV